MTNDSHTVSHSVDDRARQSQGSSEVAIYKMVQRALVERQIGGGTLVDVGCGSGKLWSLVSDRFERYVGVDIIRYAGFPADAEFSQVNLDTGRSQLADESADVVAAVETIEHLENPRAFMRELIRLVKPGGWVVVTTPNQLSLLSLLTLVVKHQFQAFQKADYPAHLTALLEIDLRRIADECTLVDVGVQYSLRGRLVLTSGHYPEFVAQLFPKRLSDNLLLIGRKLSV